MVFTYWRDQHTDVLGNYLSFEEHTKLDVMRSMNKCKNMLCAVKTWIKSDTTYRNVMKMRLTQKRWHSFDRDNYNANSQTSRLNNGDWNIQISKVDIIVSFGCHLCNFIWENPSSGIIIIGDFNVNWSDEVERRSLYNLTIKENGLEQLKTSCTTDIDHGYTNLITEEAQAGVLETNFWDRKAIWATVNVRK